MSKSTSTTRRSRYQTLTANFRGDVREERADGRDYLVVPMTMIVPGVLNGSRGALLYPADEVSRDVDAWNHMPIVVNHPTNSNGSPVSARDPKVLAKFGVGYVYNTTFDGKLKAEAWFDIKKTTKVEPTIISNIRARRKMEISTGLFTDNHVANGRHNGTQYQFVARNYRPDHLAILTGEEGACSVKDGCGLMVNKKKVTTNCDGDHKCDKCAAKEKKAKVKAYAGLKKKQAKVTGNVKGKMDSKERRIAKLLANGPPREWDKWNAYQKEQYVNEFLNNAGNCGIGSGGFQKGNKCAGGGAGTAPEKKSSGLSARRKAKLKNAAAGAMMAARPGSTIAHVGGKLAKKAIGEHASRLSDKARITLKALGYGLTGAAVAAGAVKIGLALKGSHEIQDILHGRHPDHPLVDTKDYLKARGVQGVIHVSGSADLHRTSLPESMKRGLQMQMGLVSHGENAFAYRDPKTGMGYIFIRDKAPKAVIAHELGHVIDFHKRKPGNLSMAFDQSNVGILLGRQYKREKTAWDYGKEGAPIKSALGTYGMIKHGTRAGFAAGAAVGLYAATRKPKAQPKPKSAKRTRAEYLAQVQKSREHGQEIGKAAFHGLFGPVGGSVYGYRKAKRLGRSKLKGTILGGASGVLGPSGTMIYASVSNAKVAGGNCGIGSGGFQRGNKCAGGGVGGSADSFKDRLREKSRKDKSFDEEEYIGRQVMRKDRAVSKPSRAYGIAHKVGRTLLGSTLGHTGGLIAGGVAGALIGSRAGTLGSKVGMQFGGIAGALAGQVIGGGLGLRSAFKRDRKKSSVAQRRRNLTKLGIGLAGAYAGANIAGGILLSRATKSRG